MGGSPTYTNNPRGQFYRITVSPLILDLQAFGYFYKMPEVNNINKRKGLFWLLVLECSDYDQLVPSLLALHCGKREGSEDTIHLLAVT